MIKWIAIFLLVVNVLVFLGRDKQSGEQEQVVKGPPAIDLQHMMLSSESQDPASAADVIQEEALVAAKDIEPAGMVFKIDDGLGTGSDAGGEADNQAPATQGDAEQGQASATKADKGEAPAPDSPPAKPAPTPVLSCYQAGPFSSDGDQALRSALLGLGIAFDTEESKIDAEVKSARVYIGPFSSNAELSAQQAQLKSKKIDSFVLTRPNGRVIQLGYFSKAGEALKNAKSLQGALKQKGVQAELETDRVAASVNRTIRFKAEKAQLEGEPVSKLPAAKKIKLVDCP